MKINITLLLFVYIIIHPGFLKSQCYTVLSIKGEIILEKTGQPIQEMDEICSNDKLIFSTKDSKAAVLSPEKGRFIIRISETAAENNKIGIITEYLKSVIFQGKERMSTKGLGSLDEEFGEEYMIIEKAKILVDNTEFIMNDNNLFYLKFNYEGKEKNYKLDFYKDTLFISRDIFKRDGSKYDFENIEKVSLYYNEKEKSKSTKITSFKLKFIDDKKLVKVLTNYISILKNSDKSNQNIIDEVTLFANDLYGNVNPYDFKIFLNKNFNIKE